MTSRHEFHDLESCPSYKMWVMGLEDYQNCQMVSGWSLIGKYAWHYKSLHEREYNGEGHHRQDLRAWDTVGTVSMCNKQFLRLDNDWNWERI